MTENKDVLFEEMPGKNGKLGIIILNRPAALNALNHEMILAIDKQLSEWEITHAIKAVLIRAVPGRAFCAGGDVRSIYDKKQENHPHLTEFFIDEYRLNRRIFHFRKPYIALLDGITMGGGAGVSIHGSHRVATENLTFAMPEASIGFFLDIGSSYFMSRLPFSMGFYLGMTSERIAYQDCHALGLIDEVIAKDSQTKLIDALLETEITNNDSVTHILKSFAVTPQPSNLLKLSKEITACFAKNTCDEVITALQLYQSEWAEKTLAIIQAKSPTSIKVIFEELKQATTREFDACLQMEYGLMRHFLQSHDFYEGVRAALVDKDRNPRWQPAQLAEVTATEVSAYFSTLKDQQAIQL